MGKNNRSRRAAKARQKRQHDSRRQRRRPGPETQDRFARGAGHGPDALLVDAAYAHRAGHDDARDTLVASLVRLPSSDVAGVIAHLLERKVATMWEDGWQPVDVARFVSKRLGRGEAELLRAAIAAQAVDYWQWGTAVAPEWMAQLEELGAVSTPEALPPWPLQCAGSWDTVVASAVVLMALLDSLPVLPHLMPPPSRWPATWARRPPATGRLEPGVLERIRALLAKAESTQFEAEAEAFTAKAQEMLTRYRIDRPSLTADDEPADPEVIGRRVGVDDPYARAKAILIAGIARANACRAAWSAEFGFATVHGHPDDVDGVEELYTSLLVQATSALQREGSKQDRFGRSRTARFRRSFLIGFAARIAQRLQEADVETVRRAERETGVALVPFVASRARAAEKAMRAVHGRMRGMSVSVSDSEGFELGTRVAEQANLTVGSAEELTGSSTPSLG